MLGIDEYSDHYSVLPLCPRREFLCWEVSNSLIGCFGRPCIFVRLSAEFRLVEDASSADNYISWMGFHNSI